MKTPVNNIDVFNFQIEPIESVYPVTIPDENGAPQVIQRVISDDLINQIQTSDMSLSSLLKSGIDPSQMKIDTTHSSKLDEVQTAIRGLSNIELPEPITESEIEN